ncbi:hypothetical protein TcCL_Unassigned01638 [Trypanosoma cruzi]|nr:hypothetical protein TcCL_Unassigned01638 [Trypanosoma cruzi]
MPNNTSSWINILGFREKHLHGVVAIFICNPLLAQFPRKKIIQPHVGCTRSSLQQDFLYAAAHGPLRSLFTPRHVSSCSVGTITGATASKRHHNTRAMKHPTRTAQLRPAGAAGSKGQSRLFRPAVPMALGAALARLGGRCAMRPHCNVCR